MAGFITYIKQLKTTIGERRELINTLIELQDEHEESIAPLLNDIREVLGGFSFRGQLYRQYETELARHVTFNQPAVELLVMSLERLSLNYAFLEKEIKRMFALQFSYTNITYDRVNLMRYIESVAFYLRYTRKFFLAVLAEESAFYGASTPASWSKAEQEYLRDNLSAFAGLFDAINRTEADLKAAFAKVPNAEVNEETHEMAVKTLGNSRLDPMRLANFSPQRNLLFSLGKALVEMKVRRYKAAQNELYALQLRLHELRVRKLTAGGEISPKTQKLITMYENRIEALDHQIEKIEQDTLDT